MPKKKNPAAVRLAKMRRDKLTPERRAEIATNAGKANGRKWAAIRAAKIAAAASGQDLTSSAR